MSLGASVCGKILIQFIYSSTPEQHFLKKTFEHNSNEATNCINKQQLSDILDEIKIDVNEDDIDNFFR